MFKPFWFTCFAIILNVIGYSKSAEFDDCPIGPSNTAHLGEFNNISSTKCYTLSRLDYDFPGALQYCESIGGKVVDPLSYGELDRLWIAINASYPFPWSNPGLFWINYHDMDLQVSMIIDPIKEDWNSTISNNTFAMRSLTTFDPMPNSWWNRNFKDGYRRPGYHCAAFRAGGYGIEDYICADPSPTVYRAWALCEKPKIDTFHKYLNYIDEPVYP